MINLFKRTKTVMQNENELMIVRSDKQGKTINYTTPTQEGIVDSFQVGVSWRSLKNLYERSKRNVFEWEIRDKSITINGKDDKWAIKYSSQTANLSVQVFLSVTETRLMKEALFDKDFIASNIDR